MPDLITEQRISAGWHVKPEVLAERHLPCLGQMIFRTDAELRGFCMSLWQERFGDHGYYGEGGFLSIV